MKGHIDRCRRSRLVLGAIILPAYFPNRPNRSTIHICKRVGMEARAAFGVRPGSASWPDDREMELEGPR